MTDLVTLNDFRDIPRGENDAQPPELHVESWTEFAERAGDHVPTLVDGLWPHDCLGFIAAPPKKGKTWIAIALAVSVASGTPYLGRFPIPEPRPVLYVALEGHRAALKARVGAIARGAGLNPDKDHLDRLTFAYKPRGINLANGDWARALLRAADRQNAALVIIDVLRAAATIKENAPEEFLKLRANLEPLLQEGRSIALLHHFGKLTEITKDRTPGERMSGSGAMYGSMDVGLFITGSEDGARKLRLEIESRDIATPERIGVHIRGKGTGPHGGFLYHDRATIDCDDDTPDERDLKAPAEEIRDYVTEQGGDVEAKYVKAYFEISDGTLTARLGKLMQLGIDYVGGRGKPGRLVVHEDSGLPDKFPSSSVPQDWGTNELTNFPASTSQNGASSTEFHNHPNVELESADLQGKSSSPVPHSPTESGTVPAELPHHEQKPFDDTEPDPDDTPFR